MTINRGAILKAIQQPYLKTRPDFQPGDKVRVDYKVTEGNRTRIQAFEGVVIAFANGGTSRSFTVRKVSFNEGVERIFPLHTPLIDKITVLERGKVRRAKLYYLRKLRGKATRIKADRGRMMKGDQATEEIVAAPEAEAAVETNETVSTETKE